MKKLVLVLLMMIPLVAFGQDRVFPEVLEITEDMKTVKSTLEIALPLKLSNPLTEATGLSINPIYKEKYEAIIYAPGFKSYLMARPPKTQYQESWLKSQNAQLSAKWGYRNGNLSVCNPRIFEELIDYDIRINYGLDMEYLIYAFFGYIEAVYTNNPLTYR